MKKKFKKLFPGKEKKQTSQVEVNQTPKNLLIKESVNQTKGVEDSQTFKELLSAIEENNLARIKKLVEIIDKSLLSEKDEYNNTALHYAAAKGNVEVVEILLQAGVEVDIHGNYGFTPLHVAVGQGHWDVVFKFIQLEANPNSQDDEGNTPLHLAAEGNDLKLLRLLYEKGGNIGAVNGYDWSVLHSSASGLIKTVGTDENWDIIKWLLKKGVKTDVKTKSGLDVKGVLVENSYYYVEQYEKLLDECKQELEASIRQV